MVLHDQVKRNVHQNMLYKLEWPGTSWKHHKQGGTTWYKLKYLKQGVTTNHKMDSATNWYRKQEIDRSKLSVQHHCPIEYNIGNSHCHKEHRLRSFHVESPTTQ